MLRNCIVWYLCLMAAQGPGLCSCGLRAHFEACLHTAFDEPHVHLSRPDGSLITLPLSRGTCCGRTGKEIPAPRTHHHLPCGNHHGPDGSQCPCDLCLHAAITNGGSSSMEACPRPNVTRDHFAGEIWFSERSACCSVLLARRDVAPFGSGPANGREILRAAGILRC